MRKKQLVKALGESRHKRIKLIQQNKEYKGFKNPNGTITFLNLTKRTLLQKAYKRDDFNEVLLKSLASSIEADKYNKKITEKAI